MPGATPLSDGFSSCYRGLTDFSHRPTVVGSMAAHVVLLWIHHVFANFKRWALDTYHGVRKPHMRRYLDEFVYRWNRRRHMRSSFDMLIDIATRLPHAGCVHTTVFTFSCSPAAGVTTTGATFITRSPPGAFAITARARSWNTT